MKEFYIKMSTWGTATPNIIDDEAMYQAERGMNYLNPNDYDFLCEAECLHDAEEFYFEELSKQIFDCVAEAAHP